MDTTSGSGKLFLTGETRRQWLLRISAQWKNERATFEPHWRELGEHLAPRRTRFFAQDKNRGDKRNQKIINEAGMLGLRTLRAGMMSGITSPARPWRRLTTPDPDLADYGPVKDWLYTVNKRLTTFNLRSNFYQTTPNLYGDLGGFGTGAVGMFDDTEDLYRFYSFPIGSYWVACNHRGRVDTFMREFQMTVRQVVEQFGDAEATEAKKWDNFSKYIKDQWEHGNYEFPVLITMVVCPNPAFDPRKLDSKYKRFACYYYETGVMSIHGISDSSVNVGMLQEKGFTMFPIMVPRWEVTGEDSYGTSCPGMQALASVKELQALVKKKAKGLNKQLDPPLTGPTSLRTQKTSLISGDITYVDVREGQQGLRPIHEAKFSHADVRADIQDLERRISRTFYEDLWLMLDQMEGVQPRNEKELAERHEEKLIALGPVLEAVNDEFLDPLTDLEFEKLNQYGMIPPPPQEIAGQPLKVEYESMMAQAQKLVGIGGTERFLTFAVNLSQTFPDVRDKINADQAIDEYADMMGVASNMVYEDDIVQAKRQARQKAMQQQAAAQMAGNAAEAAKTLSQADTSGKNALTEMMDAAKAGAPAPVAA
jgi:hypothetical protein